ncbi:DUF3857 domain-containing transglutaminase family protein [Candidatus Fermentibacteria bacterium]|nr:DUF3857 domain-containing transglutaminase family protein [Candidatus Fermentibacteria bacterium]
MLHVLLLLLVADPTPDAVRTACLRADSVGRAAGAEAVVVFDSTLVEVEDSGRGHFRRHTLITYLDADEARAARVQRVDYDSRANDHRIVKAIVHGSDGTSRFVNLDECVDTEAPADGIYWGARMRLYDMGMLRPGEALEVWTHRVGYQIAYLAGEIPSTQFVPPQEGEFYDVVVFGEGHPVLEKTYQLIMPRGKPVQFAEYNGDLNDSVRFRGAHLVYTWTARDLPAVPREAFSADASDFLPKVVLSTLENWPARARWFHETNEGQFAPTEAIAERTHALINAFSRDEDRFLALQQWVATHIRYSGLSMGEGEGYTLHPAEMIFSERSGVCKDLAGMLVAMLRVAGYETYPVMTMAGARVEDIPADQFNHCVVAVRRSDGSFFMLDPTWCAYSAYHWSRSEGHQHYVIGSPEGGTLMQMPLFDEDNRVSWRLECGVSERGDLSGVFLIEPLGNYETNYRRQLAYRRPAERDALFASYLRGLGSSVRITGVTHSDPDDLWKPFRLRIEFEAPGYALVDGRALVFRQPLLALLTEGAKLSALSRYAREGARQNPALIWATRWEDASEALRLPRGYSPVNPDTAAISFDRGPVRLSLKTAINGRIFRTTVEGRIMNRYLTPEEFKAVAEASSMLTGRAAKRVMCTTGRNRR